METKANYSTSNVLLYCPLSLHYFPNMSNDDFFGQVDLDDHDLFESKKVESGHDIWLDTLEKVAEQIQRHLPNDPTDDADYDGIKEQIVGCDVGVEIHDGSAWLSMKYSVTGGEETDITLLKAFAAEQLTNLELGISEHLFVPIDNGMLCMFADAADYFPGPAFYNISDNHIRLPHELPGNEVQAKEKPSVMQKIGKTNTKNQTGQEKQRKANQIRKISKPEL